MNNISSIYKYTMITWTFIIFATYIFIINEKVDGTKDIATNIVGTALKQDTMFRYWGSSHGGVYVKATKRTPPNVNLSHIKNRDIVTKDLNLTLMNPAYMLRQMMQEYKGLYGLKGHITSLKVLNTTYNMPDNWEKKVLLKIEKTKNTDVFYEEVEDKGEKYLRAFEPLVTKKSCLKCHGFQGYKIGDIRGGVSINLPLDELLKKRNISIMKISFAFLAIYILGLLLIRYFYNNALIKTIQEKKLQEELKMSEKYFKEVVNTSRNIIIINHDQEIENTNQAFFDFTGFESLNQFKQKYECICDLFINEKGFITKKVEGEYWLDYIYKNQDIIHKAMLRKENETHTFILYVNKFYIDENNSKYVAVFNDITEILKKDDIMMAQSKNAAMGEMISLIAHQWRQPIATIAMNANIMLADISFSNKIEDDDIERISKSILGQTQHLSDTIDDFKDFFKPKKTTEKVFVNDIINQSLTVIGKSLENNNIEFKKDYQSDTQVDLLSRELLQVIINIIKNAKEALIEKEIQDASITAATYEDKKNVYIKICDNGKGIKESILDKIFEPYFTTKDESSGTGLGLYMSKTIIEKHLHGTLEYLNENGACFLIKLNKGI